MSKIRWFIICLTFLLALSCGAPNTLSPVTPEKPAKATVTPTTGGEVDATPAPAATPSTGMLSGDDRQIRQNLLRSTVQIIALVKEDGRFQPLWTGSGSILTPEGLILTNAHVVSDPDPNYQPDALGIAITVRSDDVPELRYLAEIRAIDGDLDLAVIQIVSDLSGNPVDPARLGLTYVALGDSDVLELGDLLHILGYPGIGGETITFTEGVVSGFTREPGVDGRAYVKTDATIAGGNSGGLAANLGGEIIGVPTQVGYGGAERFADCRYLADTNGDGYINQNDNCIPVGGFINAIRPVNLAKPLVEAARLGIAPRATPQPKTPGAPSTGSQFFNLVFAPAVTDNDQPTQIVNQLPSGATEVYACWEYAGLTDGVTWEARWYRDGVYQTDVSWPAAPWKGGASGSWWVSINNENGLLEGAYRLELYIDGQKQTDGTVGVGGTASGVAITNLIFSDGITADERPTNPTYLLPSGITRVYAFFDFAEMRDGMAWQRVWSYAGKEIASKAATWNAGSRGSLSVSLSSGAPLDPGSYRLEIYVEGALMAASNFSVAGKQGQSAIGAITFAAGQDARGNPINPGAAFPTGLQELRYFVNYVGMQDGLSFTEKWYFDDEELLTMDLTWDVGEAGTFTDNIYRQGGEPLWDGAYRLELYVQGVLVQQATATVGGSAPPATPVAPGKSLLIRGYVVDANTQRGINGALYIVLNPGVTVDGWDGNDDGIYTFAQTGVKGYFELPTALPRNKTYSIIVWAEGYLPVTGDNIQIMNEASPYEVKVALQKE